MSLFTTTIKATRVRNETSFVQVEESMHKFSGSCRCEDEFYVVVY